MTVYDLKVLYQITDDHSISLSLSFLHLRGHHHNHYYHYFFVCLFLFHCRRFDFTVTGNRNFWLYCCVLDRLILRLAMSRLSSDSLMFFAISTKMAYSILKSYHFNQSLQKYQIDCKHTHKTIISPLGTLYIQCSTYNNCK